jgi:hypothetical protein
MLAIVESFGLFASASVDVGVRRPASPKILGGVDADAVQQV